MFFTLLIKILRWFNNRYYPSGSGEAKDYFNGVVDLIKQIRDEPWRRE